MHFVVIYGSIIFRPESRFRALFHLNSETSKDKRNETDYKNMFFVCVCVCNKCFPFYVVISCIL